MDEDNETWIIEAGDAVIQARGAQGPAALQPLERLIYCLWVADYGMRNAGDLDAASDLYADFQAEAAGLARDLELPATRAAFALSRALLPGLRCRLRGNPGEAGLNLQFPTRVPISRLRVRPGASRNGTGRQVGPGKGQGAARPLPHSAQITPKSRSRVSRFVFLSGLASAEGLRPEGRGNET